jgi:AbrB family looped-hinge helix DNA binding protein
MTVLHDRIELMPRPSRISVVTERGQTSIPAELRKELGLKQGQQLLWEWVGERELKLTVLADSEPKGAVAMLGFASRFRKARRTSEWMRELREGDE